MSNYPLRLKNDHMFLELENGSWLIDTGAPSSFGSEITASIEGIDFDVQPDYMGMTVDQLRDSIGAELAGLIGGDILNNFDFIMDLPNEIVTISSTELDGVGTFLNIDEFMEIPIVTVGVNGREFKMFLDTGAQISYLQDDIIETFPTSDSLTDFYPGYGTFETDTHVIELDLGNEQFSLRCGTLPLMLGMTLMMGGTEGILGNDIFREKKVSYFPRRGLMAI